MSRRGLKLVSSLHVALFRASGGRIGGRLRGNLPVLLLTTAGRKSGKQRTTPLLYVRDGDQYAIVASVGGAPKHPAWYLNLQDDPDATIQIGHQRIDVRAETAAPEERTRLWALVTEMYSGYDAYQAKTTREIPVVVLTPSRPSARTDRRAG